MPSERKHPEREPGVWKEREVSVSRGALLLEQLCLGIAHHVLAGRMVSELGEQPLGHGEALAETGIHILPAYRRDHIAVDLQGPAATFQPAVSSAPSFTLNVHRHSGL